MTIAGCIVALAAFLDSGSTTSDANWLQFRGPGSRAAKPAAKAPLRWDAGAPGAWKVELPGRGLSSPIVIGERVVVTASSGFHQDRLHVLCFSIADGAKQWERQLWSTGLTMCHPKTCMAAPTPVSDGERIYALFASNDLVCLDLAGNVLWVRALALAYPQAINSVGLSSSPVVAGETLVVQIETDSDAFALGVDRLSGRNGWKVERPRSVNWTSPVAYPDPLRSERSLVLLQSPGKLSAHDPASGREVWALDLESHWIASTTPAEGKLFVPASSTLRAFEPGDEGEPRLLWTSRRMRFSYASPVVLDGRVYVLDDSILKCAAAASGEIDWQLRLAGPFSGTPVIAGEHLYAVNEDGRLHTVLCGENGEVVATSELGEAILCTPAVAAGALFVRSDGSLWKIAGS